MVHEDAKYYVLIKMVLNSNRRVTFQFLITLQWFPYPLRASDKESDTSDSLPDVDKVKVKFELDFVDLSAR